jgi:hypothetical protein
MAYDSGKRLLLYALVKGLGDAVRRNDQSAARRYRRRLRLATEQIAARSRIISSQRANRSVRLCAPLHATDTMTCSRKAWT